MSLAWETLAATPDGEAVQAVTLENGHGLRARIMNFGATLLELRVPGRRGTATDVVLGFDDASAYFSESPYFGAVIGRFANRIAGGRFKLNGIEYTLATNNGENHLHGGLRGFDKVIWRAVDERSGSRPSVTWHYVSPDGEEGYPGTLYVQVTYTLTADNALQLDYVARTDAMTVLNLTHHAYWNLAGGGDVLDHRLEILGSRFLPVDAGLIPTGELRRVAGTPMDFRAPTPIRARLDPGDPQSQCANGGYDHNWILDHGGNHHPALAARLQAPRTGIAMEVLTTQPGLQFYSGNFLDGSLVGKGGQPYKKHAGLCLETQHFPDSPNRPEFPSTVLAVGDVYRQTTIYRFHIAAGE
ncbi:MAG: aldose epimerase family protein [Betaproteobacteria bacterium]